MTQSYKQITLNLSNIPNSVGDKIATICLNRPDVANAMSGESIAEIKAVFQHLATDHLIRAIVLKGNGKHFCAGADLNWMKASATLNEEENIQSASELIDMFEAIYRSRCPVIGVAHGAVYGGAVGLMACCDIVIAAEKTNFCLSEVRVGLMPATIMPYLGRRMTPGSLRRLSLSARVFNAQEAEKNGLVDRVGPMDQISSILVDEINQLLSASPEAQTQLKELHIQLADKNFQQSEATAHSIAKIRKSESGQAGLNAFFKKQSPPWKSELNDDWTPDDC